MKNWHEKGFISIFILLVTSVLAMIVAILIYMAIGHNQNVLASTNGVKAQYLAEAGLKHAITKLKFDKEFSQENPTTLTKSMQISLISSTNTFSEGIYKVYIYGTNSKRTIISIGTVKTVEKQIVATIQLETNDEAFRIIEIHN